ncbi:MAG: Nramp family divalent metal transporter [Chloroflexota bacterium]|nr:Nramp family divalent metal transporter [Chloroflexota bacterium]
MLCPLWFPVTLPAVPRLGRPRRSPLFFLSILGPGLIAAIAGDDASGVATYSVDGARYGLGLLWMITVITISLMVVQEMAARMGAVTGKGFADLVRERFSLRWTAFVMLSLLIANSVLVVSEFAGIGAAAELFGLPRWPVVLVMAGVVWWLVVKGSYKRVEIVFLAMSLAFFAYPVAAVLAKPDWLDVGRNLVVPSFHFNNAYLLLFVATVGTTLTPYMQLYIQSAVAEKGVSIDNYGGQRIDAYWGAIFADLVAAFIIVATGATLFKQGIAVETAQDAARALEPLAGPFAGYLFAVGLFGASVLAAAVVPLATTYSVTEAIGFERGVSRSFSEAPVFLGLYTGLNALGAIVAMIPGIPVIQLLIVTQVLNGVLLPVELVTIVRLANDRDIMGKHTNGPIRNALAYGTAGAISLMSIAYVSITILGLFGLNLA